MKSQICQILLLITNPANTKYVQAIPKLNTNVLILWVLLTLLFLYSIYTFQGLKKDPFSFFFFFFKTPFH